METKKDKKANKKFDLKKFEVAKLKNIHLINGGNPGTDEPDTITDTSSNCDKNGNKF